MNALLVLFFLSIIINDILFKQAYMIKIFICLFTVYLVIYFFTKKSIFHSIYKKIQLASFSHSLDPSIYGKVKLPTMKLKAFLDEYNKVNSTKITWTLLVTKVLATSIAKFPKFNKAIRCGNLVPRNSIDVSLLINISGKVSFYSKIKWCVVYKFIYYNKNLAKKLLRNVDKRSLKDLNEELHSSANTIRSGKDKDFNKQVNLLGLFPSL